MNVRTTQILTFEKKGVQPKHENGVRWGGGGSTKAQNSVR